MSLLPLSQVPQPVQRSGSMWSLGSSYFDGTFMQILMA
jgi:hypothetical protein